jgi:hypothetical protein
MVDTIAFQVHELARPLGAFDRTRCPEAVRGAAPARGSRQVFSGAGQMRSLEGEANFALAMEWRLWRGLRSFPRRPRYARYPPN